MQYLEHNLRQKLLLKIYQLAPFNLEGDLIGVTPDIKKEFISCLICTTRPAPLEMLLSDLYKQTLDKNKFEVLLLDDSHNGDEQTINKYTNILSIKYLRNINSRGMIGDLRNRTIAHSVGEYILFLDDDTRIFQTDFLEKSLLLFNNCNANVIMPKGKSLPNTKNLKYAFLDEFSFANRCCLYKRETLLKLNGFRNDIAAYEDIELGIRLTILGGNILKTTELEYLHPPLYFDSLKKPLAIGQSILNLRRHYPFYIWLMIYFNALRFLPLCLIPTTKNLQWFKISIGVLLSPFFKKQYHY